MLSIVFGLISMCLGLYGIITNWWYVVDVLAAMLPIFLLFGGFVALMAGIKNTGLKAKIKEGNGKQAEVESEEDNTEE
jgi:vacuolar-type H+-ATPase subunit I/STV1